MIASTEYIYVVACLTAFCCQVDGLAGLIALVCGAIVYFDIILLLQVLADNRFILGMLEENQYEICYGPQFRMRLVFFAFMWNNTIALLTFLTSLAMCDERGNVYAKISAFLEKQMYLSNGPALLVLCIMALLEVDKYTSFC